MHTYAIYIHLIGLTGNNKFGVVHDPVRVFQITLKTKSNRRELSVTCHFVFFIIYRIITNANKFDSVRTFKLNNDVYERRARGNASLVFAVFVE